MQYSCLAAITVSLVYMLYLNFSLGFGLCEYEVLHVLPFDSNRKRMSIIVRHPQTHQKILYCKGELLCWLSCVKLLYF